MANVAVFTDDGDDRVTLVHYRPSDLAQARLDQARAMVDESNIPTPPSTTESEVARLYYTDSNGLEYRVETR